MASNIYNRGSYDFYITDNIAYTMDNEIIYRIFVWNIPDTFDMEYIVSYFSQFGTLLTYRFLSRDLENGDVSYYGYMEFQNASDVGQMLLIANHYMEDALIGIEPSWLQPKQADMKDVPRSGINEQLFTVASRAANEERRLEEAANHNLVADVQNLSVVRSGGPVPGNTQTYPTPTYSSLRLSASTTFKVATTASSKRTNFPYENATPNDTTRYAAGENTSVRSYVYTPSNSANIGNDNNNASIERSQLAPSSSFNYNQNQSSSFRIYNSTINNNIAHAASIPNISNVANLLKSSNLSNISNSSSNVSKVAHVAPTNLANVSNFSNDGHIANLASFASATNVGYIDNHANLTNVCNFSNVSQTDNFVSATNMSNMCNMSHMSNICNMSNFSNIGNVANLANMSNASNAEHFNNFVNISNVANLSTTAVRDSMQYMKNDSFSAYNLTSNVAASTYVANNATVAIKNQFEKTTTTSVTMRANAPPFVQSRPSEQFFTPRVNTAPRHGRNTIYKGPYRSMLENGERSLNYRSRSHDNVRGYITGAQEAECFETQTCIPMERRSVSLSARTTLYGSEREQYLMKRGFAKRN